MFIQVGRGNFPPKGFREYVVAIVHISINPCAVRFRFFLSVIGVVLFFLVEVGRPLSRLLFFAILST